MSDRIKDRAALRTLAAEAATAGFEYVMLTPDELVVYGPDDIAMQVRLLDGADPIIAVGGTAYVGSLPADAAASREMVAAVAPKGRMSP